NSVSRKCNEKKSEQVASPNEHQPLARLLLVGGL
ncbi:MAG: hypothetical protein ACI8W8_002237, partial [Rhodothermales bacterium]